MKLLSLPVFCGAFLIGALLGTASADCASSAQTTWPSAGKSYAIEAHAFGKTCDHAVAVVVIRGPRGQALWQDAFAANTLAPLVGTSDAAAMTTALADWISQKNVMYQTTADLPPWQAGADQPMNGEFPFIPNPENSDTPQTWEKLRNSKTPVVCYVQGMESMGCFMLEKKAGTLTRIGTQLFPG